MAFDFKKEYPLEYRPKRTPGLIEVPHMRYVAVQGSGNPNDETGEYKDALAVLYAVSYTLRMSPKAGYSIPGYFEYVVPPLEGFWWGEGTGYIDLSRKEDFEWISAIRVPDFVRDEDFAWAQQQAAAKKKLDCSKAHLLPMDEGLCVQCMHVGPYDTEPQTIEKMHVFAEESGYAIDLTDKRRHHEIYLGDPRKTAPDKLKTVIRLPVRAVS